MKKFAVLFLALLAAAALTACAGSPSSAQASSPALEVSVSQAASAAESEALPAASEPGTGSEAAPEAQPAPEGSRILVAYFSATNTTEGVAEHIADILGADLYEIVPEVPYTAADLDYNDSDSRTTLEMNDPDARPAISGAVENMEQYDVVFLGYPIWWGEAPRILSTFAESYDFAGKTLVPFCTSGSSGIGSSAARLQALTDGAVWLDGQRFSGGSSRDAVAAWIDGLALDAAAE